MPVNKEALYDVVNIPLEAVFKYGKGCVDAVKGRWTGEVRIPRYNEYYISGGIPQVYKAHDSMTREWPIAELVEVKTVSYVKVKATKFTY